MRGGSKDETRRRIIEAAYQSFWRLGFTRANVDTIAAEAGVTKRTLYAHLRSKDDLLAAVMGHYQRLQMERLERISAAMPRSRDGIVDSLFAQLAGWAGATPRWSGSGFTRLAVELADLPGHPARALAKRAKATTETWLAELLSGARVSRPRERARELMLLLEGAMALTLIHGERDYMRAAAAAAKRLLRAR
ncbi:MAG: TetR/AcrR family transcriptional regulator [Variibacter sp.]|nr:TetR/AcrR family transcriptional regulator [Variibacter sp.]